MLPIAAEAKAPSMQAFGWFAAIYTGAFALGIVGLAYLLVASWLAT